jgi:hypothetical protein
MPPNQRPDKNKVHGMPRFVILTHNHPDWHWDFMLESCDALRTWRLVPGNLASASLISETLTSDPGSGHLLEAVPLPAHRRHYLDYEGPVSGGRGEVHQWDHGHYDMIKDEADEVIVRLEGTRLTGVAKIKTDKGQSTYTFEST